ncbi:hypothetical protein ES704_03017 [subsurface metagenome]
MLRKKVYVFSIFLIIIVLSSAFSVQSVVKKTNDSNVLFRVVIIPDTQKLVEEDCKEVLFNQFEYASKNADYVIHLGDLVENFDNSTQWDLIDEGFQILDDSNTSYSVIAGNHDIDEYNTLNQGVDYAPLYNEYFPVFRISQNGFFQESFGRGLENHYSIVTIKKVKFLFLFVSYYITDLEYAWIQRTIDSNQDCYIIMVTHALITKEGNVIVIHDLEFKSFYNIGMRDNVILQLCGHDPGTYFEYIENHHAISLLDYQWKDVDKHYLGILEFTNVGFGLKTYNPYTDDYYFDDQSEAENWFIDYSFPFEDDEINESKVFIAKPLISYLPFFFVSLVLVAIVIFVVKRKR